MRIAFYGDSLTRGIPGASFFRILELELPEHELVNLGRSGETVVSLYRRILRRHRHVASDIAVLWIGVNDVLSKISTSHSLLKLLLGRQSARDLAEFREYYERTLRHLCKNSPHVLTIPPLVIGEDWGNRWNGELAQQAQIIADLSCERSNVVYIDLRMLLAEELAGRPVSGYIPSRLHRIARDVLFVHSDERIDATAARRGLHVTLDGVHLCSEGARLAAEAILHRLKELL
jgi:lysophospholipase L1-like esterase